MKALEIVDDRNPFMFGKVVESEFFCNRKSEIEELKQHINNLYNVWLYSPRRYGKSSLVKRVFHECDKKDQLTLYFDFYNVTTVDDFCRKYANLISSELFNWKDDVKTITQNAINYFKNLYPKVSFTEDGTPTVSLEKSEIKDQTDIEKILQAPELIAESRNIQICIAFDEFQEIERIYPFIIHWMRSVFQHQKRVSYIFLGSQQSLMEKLFAGINSPLYESAVKMDIGNISYEDFSNYIKNKFQKHSLDISRQNVDTILNKSELHPHFTQYFASVVFNHIVNGYDQYAEDFTQQWMGRIVASQSIIFLDIFDRLSTNQRIVLLTVAKLQHGDELFSEKYRTKYKLPPTSTIRTALMSLQKQGYIFKKDKIYKVTNPVMKEWLLELK